VFKIWINFSKNNQHLTKTWNVGATLAVAQSTLCATTVRDWGNRKGCPYIPHFFRESFQKLL
jgi:glutamine synthetase type III